MKKTFYILALAAIALSCAKEMETSNPAVSGEKVTVKVALAEDDATKVAFTEAADKKSMSLAWQDTDAISINGENFTIKAGFSAHEAEFEGNAPSGSSYTIIYPGKYADMAAFNARSYASVYLAVYCDACRSYSCKHRSHEPPPDLEISLTPWTL